MTVRGVLSGLHREPCRKGFCRSDYVGCSNADDLEFFKNELRASVGSRVVVFLDASLPADL